MSQLRELVEKWPHTQCGQWCHRCQVEAYFAAQESEQRAAIEETHKALDAYGVARGFEGHYSVGYRIGLLVENMEYAKDAAIERAKLEARLDEAEWWNKETDVRQEFQDFEAMGERIQKYEFELAKLAPPDAPRAVQESKPSSQMFRDKTDEWELRIDASRQKPND